MKPPITLAPPPKVLWKRTNRLTGKRRTPTSRGNCFFFFQSGRPKYPHHKACLLRSERGGVSWGTAVFVHLAFPKPPACPSCLLSVDFSSFIQSYKQQSKSDQRPANYCWVPKRGLWVGRFFFPSRRGRSPLLPPPRVPHEPGQGPWPFSVAIFIIVFLFCEPFKTFVRKF